MPAASENIEVVDDVTVRLSRQKPHFEITFQMSRMFAQARDRLAAYLRQQNPEWSELEIRQELLRRICGTG